MFLSTIGTRMTRYKQIEYYVELILNWSCRLEIETNKCKIHLVTLFATE